MFVSGLCPCIYIHIYTLMNYKHLYVLNRSNKLWTWLIPFHAIWGLFCYVSLLQAWCALHFLQFCRGSRCPSFDWNHRQMSKSRDSAKTPDDSCLNWQAAIWIQVRQYWTVVYGCIDLAFEGYLICHPATKINEAKLWEEYELQLRQTRPCLIQTSIEISSKTQVLLIIKEFEPVKSRFQRKSRW